MPGLVAKRPRCHKPMWIHTLWPGEEPTKFCGRVLNHNGPCLTEETYKRMLADARAKYRAKVSR